MAERRKAFLPGLAAAGAVVAIVRPRDSSGRGHEGGSLASRVGAGGIATVMDHRRRPIAPDLPRAFKGLIPWVISAARFATDRAQVAIAKQLIAIPGSLVCRAAFRMAGVSVHAKGSLSHGGSQV